MRVAGQLGRGDVAEGAGDGVGQADVAAGRLRQGGAGDEERERQELESSRHQNTAVSVVPSPSMVPLER